jgi:hypothetical protein
VQQQVLLGFLLAALVLPALTAAASVIAVQSTFPLFPGAGLPLMIYSLLGTFGYRQAMNLVGLRRGRGRA